MTLLTGFLLGMPAIVAVIDGEVRTIYAYILSMAITLAFGAMFRRIGRDVTGVVQRKEALVIVGLIWVLLGFFGSIPFLIEGSIKDLPSAVFETVSGFTTTGATVISDIDHLSRATNLWRCLMHWIGGMGIVVLFIAIFPQLGVGARHLFKTESAGPITEGIRPKIRQTAMTLWWVYAAMTVICTVLLKLAGMNWFEAVCHAFSTLGTGGYSTRSASIAAFNSPLIDWILIFFMFVAGLNFALFYGAIRGKMRDLFTNYEVRWFFFINVIVALAIFFLTSDRHDSWMTGIRHSFFQTLAVTSTTGFATEDFDTYPDVARFLLFTCMFIGGCAGSTAGGLKVSRVYAVFKLMTREVQLIIRPQAIIAVKLGKKPVAPDVLTEILIYLVSYFFIFAICSLVMVIYGYDILSAMSSVVACLSSVGPGLGEFGPSRNFGAVPGAGKYMLSFCMIAGRLEIFVLLALLSPTFWKR